MNKHLSIRVAWHDNKWNGSICNHPSKNSFCIHLPRIYNEKVDYEEEAVKGKSWSRLNQDQLPPCMAEGGAFMNVSKYSREFNHPYKKEYKTGKPHDVLKPTTFEIPAYSTFAVPFWWMLRENQEDIRDGYPDIPNDEAPPFNSPWIYASRTQEAILKKFFDPIKEENSLSVFYVKGTNPIDEDSRRLIVGIGTIKRKSPILRYETTADYTFPLWDRLITHGIRPGDPMSEGILLPYHEYLDLPEDFILRTKEGKKNKHDLIDWLFYFTKTIYIGLSELQFF